MPLSLNELPSPELQSDSSRWIAVCTALGHRVKLHARRRKRKLDRRLLLAAFVKIFVWVDVLWPCVALSL
jgi:hypothetical protein